MLRAHTGTMKSSTPIGGPGLRRGHERGAAALEFALVLPILLVILLGILDFGLYFYSDLRLTQGGRDAVRYLSVGRKSQAIVGADVADPPLVFDLTERNISSRLTETKPGHSHRHVSSS